MTVLSAQNVCYDYRSRYQTVQALKNVSFDFEAGRLYAIIGKSGSGKTTFLSLLAGLDVPTAGEILANGGDIARIDRSRYRREQVSVIYQSCNLFPLLTVLENVTFPLELRRIGEPKAAARKNLRMVGLDENYEKRFPSMLSGGEQQRVAIARAMSTGNPILLADEPTGNLDVENTKTVLEILRRSAHEQNKCVIVVTHDMEAAASADVVLLMRDGILTEMSKEGDGK